MLDEEVNNLFVFFQNELGIQGSIDPLEALDLMELTYLLADKINKILERQNENIHI